MNPDRVPGPHEPHRLLNFVGKAIDSRLARQGIRLKGITMGAAGELALAVSAPADSAQPVQCIWTRDEESGEPVAGLGGSVRAMTTSPTGTLAVAGIATLLSSLPTERFPTFAFASKLHGGLPFDKDVTHELFGPCLAAGRTRWKNLECRELRQRFDPPGIVACFADSSTNEGVEIQLDVDREAGTLGLMELDLTRLSPGIRAPAAGLHRYLSFLVARRIHPDTRIVPVPELAPPGRQRVPRYRWHWGASGGWHQFVHLPEVDELAGIRRRLIGPHVEVVLGERECHSVRPTSFAPRKEAFVFPGLEPYPASYHNHTLASLVSGEQLIMGPGDLFKTTLEYARGLPGNPLVLLADSCISGLLSEDVDLQAVRLGRKGTAVAPEAGDNLVLRTRHMYERIFVSDDSPRVGEKRGVNLIGFNPGPGREELVSTLEEAGIFVNGCFIPDVDLARRHQIHAAALNVLFPADYLVGLGRTVREVTGVPTISPPAPYGIQGTRRWLTELAASLGTQGQAMESLDLRLQRVSQTSATSSRGPTVILVGTTADLEALTIPARLLGVPLLSLLAEMNCTAIVLWFENGDGAAPAAAQAVADQLGLRTKTHSFRNPSELQHLLATTEAELVLSDAVCDWRVHRAGKNSFSLRDFEMGVAGAARSLARLERKADNSFFRRYCRTTESGDEQ